MKIGKAVKALKAGEEVRRESNPCRTFFIRSGGELVECYSCEEDREYSLSYSLAVEDVLADDWEVVS